jgi:Ca-activated chloride channel family protein
MDLEHPLRLLLLPAVLLLALLLAWRLRVRGRALTRLIDSAVWPVVVSGFSPSRRTLRLLLWTLGLACLTTALARPRWGTEWQEIKRKGLDLVVALDTSRSMLAEDLKPNRLERAKLGLQDLTRRLQGDRVGLVFFAGTAFLQCPLTVDYAAFALHLQDARAGIIPRGGSDIRAALETARKAFDPAKGSDRVVLLISDGEDHDPDPDSIVAALRKEGIRLFCIGVGSPEGELIPVQDERGRPGGFLKGPEDRVVKTSLNESFLSRIAVDSGGAYVKALPTDFGVEALYDEVILKLNREESESRLVKRRRQQFPWLIGLGLVFLAAEAWLPLRRKEASS